MCSGSNISEFQDLIWVTDTKSGHIYHNQYCAACNGVTEIVYWNLITDCEYMFDALSVLYNKNCAMIMKAPTEMNSTLGKYECEIPEISRCNESGLWVSFNESINAACESISITFITQIVASGQVDTVYQNVYCYLCNQRSVEKPEYGTCQESNREIPLTFTFPLDINKYLVDKNKEDSHDICRFDQIYDQYLVSLLAVKGLTHYHDNHYGMRRVRNSSNVERKEKSCRYMLLTPNTCLHFSCIVGKCLRELFENDLKFSPF